MSRKAKRIEESFARAQRYVQDTEILGHATFFPEKEADSHAGMHGDFMVFWSRDHGVEGWYYLAHDDVGQKIAPAIGPFETSQAAFGAYVEAVDAEIRAGLALS